MSGITQQTRVTPAAGKSLAKILCLSLACSLWSLTVTATGYAAIAPITATGYGPDDLNTSTLNPSPVIPVYSCPWVDTGLANANFTPANGWNFTYAGQAASAFVQQDLTINNYFAWVVNSPNVTAPDGNVYNRPINNVDAGGSVFGITYTPQGTDPVNIHFIQAYSQSLNGGAYASFLDNPTAGSPFYDVGGAAGINTLANNGSWFLDIPLDCETGTINCAPEGIENYHTDVQFQVFIAIDTITAGVHNVTLYGGDWWGYQYSTVDYVPEPSTFTLLGSGGLVLIWARRRICRTAT